jgi:hypothetical protein
MYILKHSALFEVLMHKSPVCTHSWDFDTPELHVPGSAVALGLKTPSWCDGKGDIKTSESVQTCSSPTRGWAWLGRTVRNFAAGSLHGARQDPVATKSPP